MTLDSWHNIAASRSDIMCIFKNEGKNEKEAKGRCQLTFWEEHMLVKGREEQVFKLWVSRREAPLPSYSLVYFRPWLASAGRSKVTVKEQKVLHGLFARATPEVLGKGRGQKLQYQPPLLLFFRPLLPKPACLSFSLLLFSIALSDSRALFGLQSQ